MEIIKIKKIEDCLEGKNVWDLLFDNPISESFISHFGKLGKMIYQSFYPKPFFTLIVKGGYSLKGSLNNKTARLLLPDDSDAAIVIDNIKEHLKSFSL